MTIKQSEHFRNHKNVHYKYERQKEKKRAIRKKYEMQEEKKQEEKNPAKATSTCRKCHT